MSKSTEKVSDPKIIYDYPPPASKLLTVGDPRKMRDWPDYLAMGLTTEHIPDLARMILDDDLHWADGESDEVWAPLHAWRTLAQLRADAAVEPLIRLLSRVDEFDDDWVSEELPEVFGHIGQASIEPLTRFLADEKQGLWSRIAAAASFVEINKRHPELRKECVNALTQQLALHQDQDPTLNSFIISPLIDLKAVESALMIEAVFVAENVDIGVHGDWEDVQIELGLLQERLTPAPNYQTVWNKLFGSLRTGGISAPGQPRHQKSAQPKKKKARTKRGISSGTKLGAKRKRKEKARQKKRKRK